MGGAPIDRLHTFFELPPEGAFCVTGRMVRGDRALRNRVPTGSSLGHEVPSRMR